MVLAVFHNVDRGAVLDINNRGLIRKQCFLTSWVWSGKMGKCKAESFVIQSLSQKSSPHCHIWFRLRSVTLSVKREWSPSLRMSFLSQVRQCLEGSAGEFITSGPSTVHPVGTQPSLTSLTPTLATSHVYGRLWGPVWVNNVVSFIWVWRVTFCQNLRCIILQNSFVEITDSMPV